MGASAIRQALTSLFAGKNVGYHRRGDGLDLEEADRRTFQELESLCATEAAGTWYAAHRVVAGRGHIDHVLIGPAGVFVLETRVGHGNLRVAGGVMDAGHKAPDDLVHRDARRRAMRFRDRLQAFGIKPPWVNTVIVLWADFPQLVVTDQHVIFVHGPRLADWLRGLDRRLPAEENHRIVSIVESFETTTPDETRLRA